MKELSAIERLDAVAQMLAYDEISRHSFYVRYVAFKALPLFLTGRMIAFKGESWSNERNQLNQWMAILRIPYKPNVAEFSVSSFWTGHWTYRMLKTESCWVIGQYVKGTYLLVGCHVRRLDEVSLQDLPDGKWVVTIGKKSYTNVTIEPRNADFLGPFVRHRGALIQR